MLHVISDSLPMLINYIDMEQRYRFVNLAYQRWTGKALEQILGLTVLELIGPQACERTRAHVETALNGKGLATAHINIDKHSHMRHYLQHETERMGRTSRH